MNVYVVRFPDGGGGPDHLRAYPTFHGAISDFGPSADVTELLVIGYVAPTVEPCPELLTSMTGEMVELSPSVGVSVVIDVAAILSQCKTREAAADLIADVVAAARKA